MDTPQHRGRSAANAMARLDDVELHARAHAGSSEAYATLYRRHFHAARRLAAHLGSRDDADEVVEDAFAAVVELVPTEPTAPLDVRGVLFSTIRHEARHRTGPPGPDSPALTASAPVAGHAAYDSLPVTWRAVLWHADVEGLQNDDLAETLDVSTDDVPALVYRARVGLRDATLTDRGTGCDDVLPLLSAVMGRTAPAGDQERAHAHLATCEDCMAVYLGLADEV